MKPVSILAEPTPHQEAADFIRGKPIVSRSVFKGMLPDLKGRAFSVAGIQAANVLQDIRDSLASLPEGALWDKVKADIAADMIPFYVDTSADPELQAKQQAAAEAKAELLLRMHGFQAYAAAQYQVLDRQRPEFPFWQYHSMEDARVRPTHAALDGVVMPADSPFWADHYPPWEWGCRCIVTPLPLADVEKMIEQDKALPPEQHRVIGPAAQRQLEQSGLLIRNGGAHNVTSGFAKGDKAAFHWDPSTLRMPLEQIRRRYDPEVFTAFEAWAKRTHLQGGSGQTVWDWANQETEGKPGAVAKAKPKAPTIKTPEPTAVPEPETMPSADSIIRDVALSIDDRISEVFVLLGRKPDGTLFEKYARHQSGPTGGSVPSHWDLKDGVFIHNHPSGLLPERKGFGTSFSTDDIQSFFSGRLAEMIATSPRRLYRVKAPVIAPSGEAQGLAFAEAQTKVDAWLYPRVATGLTPLWRANAIRNHLIWKRFSKALGIEYTFERKGG